MIINQMVHGESSGGIVVTDGIVVKTRDANGRALTVDFYGTAVKQDQFYSSTTAGTGFAMTDITFKNAVTSIEAYAFYYCVALELASLPSTLTSIGNYAFRNCTALALTALPIGVTSLPSGAFRDCIGLTVLDCPGVTSVYGLSSSTGSFLNCTGLTEITLGSVGHPVTSIGLYAFTGCVQEGLTIKVYVASGTNPLANSPWGATSATIEYYDAATGNLIA